jgi:hypothetical protein
MANWESIISKAIANIKKIFSNKHEVGKQIGETAASMAVGQVVRAVYVGVTTVKVTEQERIYIDNQGSINHQSGHLVAVIYEDENGNHYKHTADNWYSWNGADWSVVPSGRIRT